MGQKNRRKLLVLKIIRFFQSDEKYDESTPMRILQEFGTL